jgi:hypothetical protein
MRDAGALGHAVEHGAGLVVRQHGAGEGYESNMDVVCGHGGANAVDEGAHEAVPKASTAFSPPKAKEFDNVSKTPCRGPILAGLRAARRARSDHRTSFLASGKSRGPARSGNLYLGAA